MWMLLKTRPNHMPSYIFMWFKEWKILWNSSCDIQRTKSFVTKPICASLLLICTLWKGWLCLINHLFYESRILHSVYRHSAAWIGLKGKLPIENWLTCTASCSHALICNFEYLTVTRSVLNEYLAICYTYNIK